MGEIVGKDFGEFGHAGIRFEGGSLIVSGALSGNALVDWLINLAEAEIPGDFDKALLEPVRIAAKLALSKL